MSFLQNIYLQNACMSHMSGIGPKVNKSEQGGGGGGGGGSKLGNLHPRCFVNVP